MSDLKAVFYDSVSEIEQKHWDSLGCCNNIYYSPKFLEAFERGNKDIIFTYVVIMRGDEAVAFANTQLVSIGIETITKNIKISDRFKRNINRFFNYNKMRVLFCGNVFLSGEYGTFLKAGENKHLMFDALASAFNDLSKKLKKVNAIFVKDFEEESLYITNLLKKYDYTPLKVEPNMIIDLKEEWQDFSDFKNDLKSKYRIKANKADSTSSSLSRKEFNDQDILEYKDELQLLYENTISNSNFNAQVLDLDTYIHLKKTFQERFRIIAYFLNDQLVGFLSAMLNEDNLDAHFIGLDYSLNKTYAIYPRILNDYLRIGLEQNAQKINLGRTASEIKSTLGAQPKPLTCYIRHKYLFQNKLMKPFVRNIKIKSFRQHQPFKQ